MSLQQEKEIKPLLPSVVHNKSTDEESDVLAVKGKSSSKEENHLNENNDSWVPPGQQGEQKTCFQKYKNMWPMVLWLGCSVASLSALGPITPVIKKKYFGSDERAARYSTAVEAIATLICFFTAPIWGLLQDTIGRKFWFILGSSFQCTATSLLIIFPLQPWPYMIVNGTTKIFATGFLNAYVADRFPDKSLRATVFGVTFAVQSLATITSLLVVFLDETTLKVLAICFAGLSLLTGIFIIEESLAKHCRKAFSCQSIHHPVRSMKYLVKSKVMRGGLGILAITAFAEIGTSEVNLYYLNSRLNFTPQQNGLMQMELGICGFFFNSVLLHLLLKFLTPTLILLLACVALLVELVVMATIWAAWPVFAFAIPCTAFALLSAPICFAMISNAGDEEDQGRRTAGLEATISLMTTTASLAIGQGYGHLHGTYQIIPYLVCGALALPAMVLAVKMPKWIEEEKDVKKLRKQSLMEDGVEGEE